MTAIQSTGASSTVTKKGWSTYSWPTIRKHVSRLQMRIAKAEREGRRGKVKSLQRLLTNSFYARCAAVKRVTSSTGAKTPGIDGVTWSTDLQKIKALSKLKRRGYKPQPLRRIYIPKKTGKLRPISMPVMKDRAMQALYLLALEPIVEERADLNAYGFRLKRSAQDAIEQCFNALGNPKSATCVLEGDIRACFDQINHDWLLENIPMDKTILRKFLKAGFMENGRFHPIEEGTPQGGVISPALTVMALSGLEKKLLPTNRRQKGREKINFIAYADDFIVTAATEELLKESVMPKLREALKSVGLELSLEKTKITSIEEGFDFLGFNVRKYKNGKLLIKPSKDNIKDFQKNIRDFIKRGVALPTEHLIHALNKKITGWTNYYRCVVSSRVFYKIDSEIFQALKRWSFKRHRSKSKRWIINKYYTHYGGNNWKFHCMIKDKNGKPMPLYLRNAGETKIRRHIKIQAKANPFDPLYKHYFVKRDKDRKSRGLLNNTAGSAGLKTLQLY